MRDVFGGRPAENMVRAGVCLPAGGTLGFAGDAWKAPRHGGRYPRYSGRYRPAHARARMLSLRRWLAVLLCGAALLGAFRLYSRARRSWGVQLCVQTVLQQPALPNGCEAASLAALLRYRGVKAEPLDLAYGYIPRGDIVQTAEGRTAPDPELAYAGDPAGLGFYCFAGPLAEGRTRILRRRALRSGRLILRALRRRDCWSTCAGGTR